MPKNLFLPLLPVSVFFSYSFFRFPQISEPPNGRLVVLRTVGGMAAQRMKTGKYFFEGGIIALHFGEKYAGLPLPLARKRGGLVVQTFHLRASLALQSFVRWRRYRADSVLLSRMTL